MLRVRLFGGVEVHVDGEPVEAPARRRRAWSLLAWLALHPGLHHRRELAARFWPDVLDESARASLRSALWALRKALGAAGDPYLVSIGDRVGIDPARPVWVDALAFEALVAEGRLEEAVALASGPLLAGLDEDWALRAADEHRERLLEVLERLASAAEGRHELDEAVRLTRRQTALDPFGEETHRRLMRRLALAGDRPAALGVYARLVDRLRRELRLTPSLVTRTLASELRERDRGRPPPTGPAVAAPPEPRARAAAGAAVRHPALVGRERDLARLAEAWRSARSGLGCAVCVSGEAGIGKTRLAAELLDRARSEGARVAACAALDLGGAAPFGLWAELVRDLARGVEPPDGPGWPAEVARLAPDLEGRPGWGTPRRPAAGPELERARLFEAIVALSDWASRDRPLLLLMEDVHTADGASLELAGYLARRIARTPVLMLLTMRQLPARPEADALLAALRARGVLADEVVLGPLAPDATGRLVRSVASLDADDVVRVVEASEGNPLLAVESARALARGEGAPSAGLRGAVRAAARGLGEEASALAGLLAVAARSLEPRELEALPLADPAGAASGGIQAGLLVADDEGRIGYRHALLREAVYADLPEPRRAQLHAAVAQALGGRGELAAEIARHLRLAHRDDLAVEQLARAAAEAQAMGALAEAVAFLEEAVRLAPDDARVLLALAEAHAWRGRREEAGAALARALERIGTRDSDALLDAHLRAGRWFRGALCDPRESLGAYRAALALLDRGVAGGDPGRRADALVGAAWCEAVAGDLDSADRLLAEADELVARGAAEGAIVHEAASARGQSLLRRGRFADACAPLLAGGEAALLARRPDRTYDCWINAAMAMACAGDFGRALEIADRLLAAMRESGLATLELEVLTARAHVLARLGRLPEAQADVTAERELANRLGDRALCARADHDAGLIALAAGDHAAAAALLGSALGGDAAIGRPRARLARAEALVHLGRLSEAEQELDATALEPTRPSDFPDTLVARLTRVEGLVAAARGDRGLAARRLDEAAAIWRRRGGDLGAGEQYVANLVDLGRPPFLGLIEPALELGRLTAELEALHATTA